MVMLGSCGAARCAGQFRTGGCWRYRSRQLPRRVGSRRAWLVEKPWRRRVPVGVCRVPGRGSSVGRVSLSPLTPRWTTRWVGVGGWCWCRARRASARPALLSRWPPAPPIGGRRCCGRAAGTGRARRRFGPGPRSCGPTRICTTASRCLRIWGRAPPTSRSSPRTAPRARWAPASRVTLSSCGSGCSTASHGSWWRRPVGSRCWWCWTTCTRPTAPRCGCCGSCCRGCAPPGCWWWGPTGSPTPIPARRWSVSLRGLRPGPPRSPWWAWAARRKGSWSPSSRDDRRMTGWPRGPMNARAATRCSSRS